MPEKPEESQTRKAILIIADISGYTQFMLSNQMELAHSQWIISQLLKAVIKQIQIPLKMAELEGDAVFLYAIKETDGVAPEEITSEVAEKLLGFFEAFSQKIGEVRQSNICQCNVCRNVGRLRLKLVVHSGEALFYQLEKFYRLSGPDVIIVHRLLKNSIESSEYILASEAAYHDLCLGEKFELVRGEENYEDTGKITVYVHFPHMTEAYLSKAEKTDPRSIIFRQIKTWLSRHANLVLMDWRLKKRPELPGLRRSMPRRIFLRWNLAHLFSMLRIALGLIFVIGGMKIGFPRDPQALAASYTNPENGFISPFFATWITGNLGIPISLFLRIQGIAEIVTGFIMMRGGVNTQMVAILMAMMFWIFTIANPVVGGIRLSRDIALAGLCIAVALTGPSAWGIDGRFKHQDSVLRIIRYSMAYTLIASALFVGGVFNNPLNTTLPIELVFLLGILLGMGTFPRWVMLPIFLWMLYVIGASVVDKGIYWGLEAVKREIGLLAASCVYLIAGPDRRTWPKKHVN